MRILLAAVLVLVACGPQDASVGLGDELDVGDAPLLGADGKDAADRACNVILRTAARTPIQGGYAQVCGSTGCWVTWTGTLDVSAQAVSEGVKPYVLYRNADHTSWTKVSATKSTGAPQGFVRYAFTLKKDTLSPGLSLTSVGNARLELSPYVLTKTGARLFDHNRRAGDFDSYVLSSSTGWDLADDAAVCGPPPEVTPSLDFQLGWRTVQRGALVAGGSATVSYALERLPDCRNTHNGYPAWDTTASVRFLPSGTTVEQSVRAFDAPNGVPQAGSVKAVPFTFAIPSGTTAVELWFHNASGAGSTCSTWDSNQGTNYRVTVEPRALPAVKWVGNPGSSFSRDCWRHEGAPTTITLDSYLFQRACSWIEVDAWAPGLSDVGDGRPEVFFAQAEYLLDGKPLPSEWLTPVGRFGNDVRLHWALPVSALYSGPKWSTLSVTFRVSTDGRAWVRDVTRTVTRDPSFVNPAWP
jgi:hypothetical protein